MPNGGSPAIAITPSARPTASTGWVTDSPLMWAMRCVPFTWAMWPTAKKIADLVSECIVMCRRPAKFASGPAHAECEGDDAHVFDRRIGEQPFDVAAAVQHEGREHQADEAEHDHDHADVERLRVRRQHHLEAQQRVERDVEQQARQHRRDRRRAFGMRVRQPGMERRQPDLGAVADQQEHEGERQQPRIEARGVLHHQVPGHRRQALRRAPPAPRDRPGWCRRRRARCRRCRE